MTRSPPWTSPTRSPTAGAARTKRQRSRRLLGLEERTVVSSRYARAQRHVIRTAPDRLGMPRLVWRATGGWHGKTRRDQRGRRARLRARQPERPTSPLGAAPGPVRPEGVSVARAPLALHHDRRRRRAGRARDLVRLERAAPFFTPTATKPNDLRRRHRDSRVPDGATRHGRFLRHRRQLLLLDIPAADGGYGLAWRATNPAPGTAPLCTSSSTGSSLGAWVRVEYAPVIVKPAVVSMRRCSAVVRNRAPS